LAAQWEGIDELPQEAVRELFGILAKALRAYQLYDENNPVYQRFVGSLRDAFRRVWEEIDGLQIQVLEDRFLLQGVEVYRSEARSDSLAFLFYKDGVREVVFLPGIEGSELTRFLSVLHRARRVRTEGDDILTLLWEAEFEYLRYQYVDLLAEGLEIPEPGPGHEQEELAAVLEGELEEGEEEDEEEGEEAGAPEDEGAQPVSQEDFNPTLYSLDAREMERLRKDIEEEMQRDLRGDVLSALFDRLEEPQNPERQAEILGIFRQLLPNLLGRGALEGAARILEELRTLEEREDILATELRTRTRDLLDQLSSPEAVAELIKALEDGSLRPDPGKLASFLSFLRGRALGPLLHAAETTEIKELQPVLREAVRGIAQRNPKGLTSLLRGSDPVVVAGAARLVGRMGLADTGPILANLMGAEHPEVRLAAVEAATDLRASTAAGALHSLLTDPDRSVRIAAARALGQLRYAPAARRFEEILKGKSVRDADLTEKIAFFESYGLVAGEDAVSFLDKLLNGRGFLGRREPPEIRACAALALGKVSGAPARDALVQARDEEDPVVRSAVNRALRGES
jgi:HEAT repeat protein